MSKGYTLTPSGPMPVKQLYTLTGGKAYPVDKAYTLTGGTARLWYQRGTPLGNLAVGSTIKIAVGGKDYDWLVVHQGLPDASIYDASCSGTWLLMKNIYEELQWTDTGKNEYASSIVHRYLNNEFLSKLSVKNTVKSVKIPYDAGGYSLNVHTGADGLQSKVFLLNLYELGFNYASYMPIDNGKKLDYFRAGDRDPLRVAYKNGFAAIWWSRDPWKGIGGSNTWYVNTKGAKERDSCNAMYGVRPCMILPQDALVDDTGHIVAA